MSWLTLQQVALFKDAMMLCVRRVQRTICTRLCQILSST